MAPRPHHPWASPSSSVPRDTGVVRPRVTRLRIAALVTALLLGFIQAWRSRHTMNPDGVSYLDISDAYLAGDWSAAINAFWSPLYSWLLAAATFVFRPSPYWEFTMVHLVNFGIYALSLAAFEFMMTELIHIRRNDASPEGAAAVDDEWAWRLLGYTFFIWSALGMIGLTIVTPDMCVAALAYLAGGILLRLRDPRAPTWLAVALGVTLGLGYLAKAAMLPLSFVFIGAGVLSSRATRRIALRWALVASISLAVVAVPFILALSIAKGYPTWGAVAKLAYAWCIDPPPNSGPLHPEDGGCVTVVEATRRISDAPVIYEFATPVAGSYPPWYDASYWYEGVSSRFLPFRMASRLFAHSLQYLRWLAPVVVAWVIVWWVNGRSREALHRMRDLAILTTPAIVALLMYGLVYVETRYLGPFLAMLSLGMLASVSRPATRAKPSLIGGAALGLASVLLVPLIVSLIANAAVLLTRPELAGRFAHTQWQVAAALGELGLQPGDAVAASGRELAPAWARLARVRIVAEIQDRANHSWVSDPAERMRVTQLLSRIGAKGVVAKGPPGGPGEPWRPVGSTGYYVLVFPSQS